MTATEMWEQYRDKVYASDLPLIETQEQQCSMAFYAGMFAAFSEVVKIADSVSDEELAAERVEEFKQSIIAAAMDTVQHELE